MTCFPASLDYGRAERTLETLVRTQLNPLLFESRIQRLQRMFSAFKVFCPAPWPSRNLQTTFEISYQSELWLPLDQLRPHFFSLYRQALTYSPIFSSTPFYQGTSWADIATGFPAFLKKCENPADLLERLVEDDTLRLKFLFWSFMPERFYGRTPDRYPGQSAIIETWIRQLGCRGKKLRCLDVASGDGATTYGLVRLMIAMNWKPDRVVIEGWTVDPLESWAAAHAQFPHDPLREKAYRKETRDCFERGFDTAVCFCVANILNTPMVEQFDLVLCNGLLGGPIIHARGELSLAVRNLTKLLAPGGMLLVADHFHGGWKQKCPQQELRALFELNGLIRIEAAEGIAVLKPD